jgi:hypothetical protein
MRSILSVVAVALFCSASGAAYAADLPVKAPRQQTAVQTAAPAQTCLRWVEQTYSWYNYCDPIPYYSRHRYDKFAGFL